MEENGYTTSKYDDYYLWLFVTKLKKMASYGFLNLPGHFYEHNQLFP